ncbi:TRP-domain-containing protein [Coprinopsis marcescibilis]|uniref:TRP-domain-containing protein n=1 Tax=Coprinopsis marcescibilis TaxID=230819 RepID=A0A5C3KZF6_COPMA|nr:TRP-domain-containing protein [Coprinopsis marcescibilis]
MFSVLAWLRAFTFTTLLFTTFVHAREDSLLTSSVTYCNPPETLLVQRFEVEFFPRTQTVAFNLSVASVQPNVNVSANLFLNVYGLQPINVTLDLCNILDGQLCPLPMSNFTGAETITLPDSLGITSLVPSIAYKIPDLEGFAQFTLVETSTGNVRACIQATLSNGWTAHQSAAEWGSGAAAIAALIVSVIVTLWAPESLAPFRFLELMYLFQTIASTGLLSLNYPVVYRAFALNFAWALGLFPTSESSVIQDSINSLRHRTGSQLADSKSGSVVQFVNRKLSPYNNDEAVTSSGSSGIGGLFRRSTEGLALSGPNALWKRSGLNGEVQTVTPNSDNVLDAGLPIYVNSLHVSVSNGFMTVFLCGLMLFGLAVALLAIGYGVHILVKKRAEKKNAKPEESTFNYLSFARSWILRIALICFGPLLIFIFYQWTLRDSWATILLSVLCLVAFIGLIGYPIFTIFRFVRRNSASELYSSGNQILAADGTLYSQYRASRFFFFTPLLAATLVRAMAIAFAKSNAEAQISLMIIAEVMVIGSTIALKPYQTRGGDIFSTYLAVVRLICTGLLIAFLQRLEVKPIPRVVIGIVIAVIFIVTVLVTLVNFVINIGLQRLWTKQTDGTSSSESFSGSEGSMLEKGVKGSTDPTLTSASRVDSDEEISRAVRPHNPTPDASTPIDNHFLCPFPISPTASTVTSLDPPSNLTSRDSASMTVGSLLSSRWSFSYSQPNSPTGSSAHGYYGSRDGGVSSLGHGQENSLSRRTSESHPSSSPSAWRPGSSSGSSSGHVTRTSSVQALQQYQTNHQNIPEHRDETS